MDKNKDMFDRLVKGLRDIYGDKLVSIYYMVHLPVKPIQRNRILI